MAPHFVPQSLSLTQRRSMVILMTMTMIMTTTMMLTRESCMVRGAVTAVARGTFWHSGNYRESTHARKQVLLAVHCTSATKRRSHSFAQEKSHSPAAQSFEVTEGILTSITAKNTSTPAPRWRSWLTTCVTYVAASGHHMGLPSGATKRCSLLHPP